jgi:hypothetical protein
MRSTLVDSARQLVLEAVENPNICSLNDRNYAEWFVSFNRQYSSFNERCKKSVRKLQRVIEAEEESNNYKSDLERCVLLYQRKELKKLNKMTASHDESIQKGREMMNAADSFIM